MSDAVKLKPDYRDLLARQGVPPTPWYAVLDAAQDELLPQRAVRSVLRNQSLYAGPLGEMLEDVAPHLVSLERLDNRLGEWLLENLATPYGIFLQSSASFEELWKHFRQFLLVKDFRGKRYRFRFYDPRILRVFLPVCTPEELRQFFGPVQTYYAAARGGEALLSFSMMGGELKTRPLRLLPAKSGSDTVS